MCGVLRMMGWVFFKMVLSVLVCVGMEVLVMLVRLEYSFLILRCLLVLLSYKSVMVCSLRVCLRSLRVLNSCW